MAKTLVHWECEFYPDLVALTESLIAKVSTMPLPKDRLTDEKWREMLKGADAPKQPSWTKAYLCPRSKYVCPVND